jgi:hypothetical protein
MSARKQSKATNNRAVPAPPPKVDTRKPDLPHVGGSKSYEWNLLIAKQTLSSAWYDNSDPEHAEKQHKAILASLVGLQPADELEGMLASQLIASHNAAMECYRRAMISEQTVEGRSENLNQANKLSRTYATLVEGLNRHRGKGQQKVTVEHVHVHNGGQAIVGNVEGGGLRTKTEDQPHALGYAPGQTLRSENAQREAVPIARDAKR